MIYLEFISNNTSVTAKSFQLFSKYTKQRKFLNSYSCFLFCINKKINLKYNIGSDCRMYSYFIYMVKIWMKNHNINQQRIFISTNTAGVIIYEVLHPFLSIVSPFISVDSFWTAILVLNLNDLHLGSFIV